MGREGIASLITSKLQRINRTKFLIPFLPYPLTARKLTQLLSSLLLVVRYPAVWLFIFASRINTWPCEKKQHFFLTVAHDKENIYLKTRSTSATSIIAIGIRANL